MMAALCDSWTKKLCAINLNIQNFKGISHRIECERVYQKEFFYLSYFNFSCCEILQFSSKELLVAKNKQPSWESRVAGDQIARSSDKLTTVVTKDARHICCV